MKEISPQKLRYSKDSVLFTKYFNPVDTHVVCLQGKTEILTGIDFRKSEKLKVWSIFTFVNEQQLENFSGAFLRFKSSRSQIFFKKGVFLGNL